MEQKQLEKFGEWFDDYVGGFYGDDPSVNGNLKLKEKHSRRVCEEMWYLGRELGLTANQKRIAGVIALFHDIGRFEQFIRYRTYNDVRSVNHCLLGLEVLTEKRVLDGIDGQEKQWIEKAIEYHGLKELPGDLDGEFLLFSKLIRDADKLDIFYVAVEYYKQRRDSPEEVVLEIDVPDNSICTAEVLEEILCGRAVDYNSLRTLNDMKLLQLGWIYDVNFTPTLNRIRQRKFLEILFDFLPETPDIERVKEKIFGYVDFRIEKDD